MGNPFLEVGGVITSSAIANFGRPTTLHFHKYLKINKEMSDVMNYAAIAPGGTGVVLPGSQVVHGNKVWTIAPQTAGTFVTAPRLQYIARLYWKNFV